ncbi:hypothetical protein [Oleiharenicola lentus]|uniref:hypothetical protein n=1 Tax=Oleiharenicola lentus TaxID=2508720 RepID=UPI003F67C16E
MNAVSSSFAAKRAARAFLAVLGIISLGAACAHASTTITANGASAGRTYEGVGGVFSNGMTRLLLDYPANQRADILKFLFQDKFGAGLQHVKVEIGADVNTSAGTEPSHMRSSTDFDITRGSNLWIAKQAKTLNSAILLDALRWGTPAWITTDANKYLYHKKFLEGARDDTAFLLNFNYLGASANETEGDVAAPTASGTIPFQRDWIVNTLRPGLNADGFSAVKLTAADSNLGWWIADKVQSDAPLKSALYSLNAHYVDYSTSGDGVERAIASGMPLWAGEHLAPGRHGFVVGVIDTAWHMIRAYTQGRMTKYEMHPALESNYPNTPFNHKSILAASWPWSGHYEVTNGVWMTAHFTQFAYPGWKYLDQACAADDSGGYVTLKDAASSNWSMIMVNYSPRPQDYVVNLSGGLSTGTVRVWRSIESSVFVQQANKTPVSNSFTITLEPYSLYSLTTTSGQTKGAATYSNPAMAPFALDYSDNFNSYTVGKQPKYFSDQGGAFEIVTEGAGKALKQIITGAAVPTKWKYRSNPDPYTLVGDVNWKNYEIEVKVKLEDSAGSVRIGGRATHNGKLDNLADCYNLLLTKPASGSSTWAIQNKETTIGAGSGTTTFNSNTWYTVVVRFENNTITAWLNGTQLGSVSAGFISSGQALLGCSFNNVRFDDLVIRKIDLTTPIACLRYNDKDTRLVWTGTWEDQDGDWENYERTMSASRESGSRLFAKFNGTAVSVIGQRSTDSGKADVYIDGALSTTIDTYAATPLDSASKSGEYIPVVHQALVTVRDLAAGDHTIEVVVRSDKNASAVDNYVRIDAIETLGGTGLLTPPTQLFWLVDDDFDTTTAGTIPAGWIVQSDASTSATVENFPSSGNRSLRLNDASVSGVTRATRKFSPLSGVVPLRFGYHATQVGKWNRIYVKSLGTNAVMLFDTDDPLLGLCYENSGGTKVKIQDIVNATWYTLDVEVDTVNDTFDLYVNGTLKVNNAALRNPVSSVDRIYAESGGSFTGTAYLDTVEVIASNWQARSFVNDHFNTQVVDEQPRWWGLSVYESTPTTPPLSENANVTCTIKAVPSAGDKSMQLHDFHSTKGVSISRGFRRTADRNVTVEYRFKTNATASLTAMSVRGRRDAAVKLVDSATNGLAYINASGTETSLQAIAANTWYTVKVILNPVSRVYDLYVDGVLKLNDQAFIANDISSLDGIVFATDPVKTSVDFNIDNVKVSVP